jgi:biopolymer transport protein ExbD
MASIDPGANTARRRVDHDLPLVPFIDFLLCLVAFLLVTAVWSQMARLPADASLGRQEDRPREAEKQLHVDMRRDNQFLLSWKQGSTVVDMATVARRQPGLGAEPRFPDLARELEEQFERHASHRDPTDRRQNRAVLHTAGATEFGEIAAVLDALAAPKRTLRTPSGPARVSAFDVTFAVD